MNKFIMRIMLFFTIIAIVDISIGNLLRYLQSNVAGGRTGAEYYACEKASEDIIIMGSSRASHHYVPEIIVERTGMSCFNAGQDGNGIVMQYGRWKMISERYSPKIIIYDITLPFDLEINDNMTYMDRLKPFSYDSSINSYISSIYPIERIKMLSRMYCYNYKFLEMLSDCVLKGDYMTTQGYIPLFGHIRQDVVDRQMDEKSYVKYDAVKLKILEQLLKDAQNVGTEVILVVSPSWKGGNYTPGSYGEIQRIAQLYDAIYLDYSDSEICNNPDYFEDSVHLNDEGAKIFTNDLFARLNRDEI